MNRLVDLDAVYFGAGSWADRFDRWIQQHSTTDTFAGANATAVEVISQRGDLGLRTAINIPAHDLLLFLRDRRYKNAYERSPQTGGTSPPSDTRQRVDNALFPAPLQPADHYFGAAVLGGAGVRYYGDYCLVLKHDDPTIIPNNTQVFDRNSYDMVFSPLEGRASLTDIADRLRGHWGTDLLPMAKMKIVPALGIAPRLTTAGAASEAFPHDESFVEVHKRQSFKPSDVHEVRESAADAAVEADLVGRRDRGQALTQEESTWVQRRHEVDRQLSIHGLRARIIVSAGRTPR